MALALADIALTAAPAAAQATRVQIDIPAGPLAASLATLSRVTGISVGLSGPMPAVRTSAVRGAMTPEVALRRMLAGTGLRAVAIDAATYRLERNRIAKPRRAPVDRAARKLAREERPGADIIVTASKRPQHLSTVPGSLSVATPDRIATGIVSPDSQTVSTGVDGLALTNLGPGRDRQFIRGVADSPFNGPSQSTVAIALDNSRITYDAPDPDLLLVDIDRVEVLKGPQGPLYGSGALGGIFHIVSNAPVDDATYGSVTVIGEGVSHGGIGGGIDGILNLPISDGLAVRGVGYVRSDAGWLDTIGGPSGTNRVMTSGGRLALRWTPDASWQIDVGGVLQSLNADDSQYVTGSAGTLKRIHPIAEPADNDFAQAHLDIRGRIGGLRLLSATSYVAQAVDYRLDASASAALFGLAAPAIFDDRRRYTIFNQELRLSPEVGGRIDWLAGLSYLHSSSSLDGSMSGSGALPIAVETIDQDVSEYAAFGEASLPLGPFTITAGARLFDDRCGGRTRRAAGHARADPAQDRLFAEPLALLAAGQGQLLLPALCPRAAARRIGCRQWFHAGTL